MSNEITIKQDELLTAIEETSLGELIKPLVTEIHLFDTFVAGTSYLEDSSVLDEIAAGDKLRLRREDNKFDEKAILLFHDHLNQTLFLTFALLESGALDILITKKFHFHIGVFIHKRLRPVFILVVHSMKQTVDGADVFTFLHLFHQPFLVGRFYQAEISCCVTMQQHFGSNKSVFVLTCPFDDFSSIFHWVKKHMTDTLYPLHRIEVSTIHYCHPSAIHHFFSGTSVFCSIELLDTRGILPPIISIYRNLHVRM